jgi:hypothetical protein
MIDEEQTSTGTPALKPFILKKNIEVFKTCINKERAAKAALPNESCKKILQYFHQL